MDIMQSIDCATKFFSSSEFILFQTILKYTLHGGIIATFTKRVIWFSTNMTLKQKFNRL